MALPAVPSVFASDVVQAVMSSVLPAAPVTPPLPPLHQRIWIRSCLMWCEQGHWFVEAEAQPEARRANLDVVMNNVALAVGGTRLFVLFSNQPMINPTAIFTRIEGGIYSWRTQQLNFPGYAYQTTARDPIVYMQARVLPSVVACQEVG